MTPTPDKPLPLTSATISTVSSTVSQALSQTAGGLIGTAGPSLTTTFPCPNGGSVTTTPSVTSGIPAMDGSPAVVTISSRTDFNDCRSQSVVIRGDPYLLTTGELTFAPSAPGTQTYSGTSTTHTSGGLRFITDGGEGRVQYDCTLVITSKNAGDGNLQVSITPGGTMSWEFPVGAPATVSNCGPAAP